MVVITYVIRGRTIIVSNEVASALWHRLSCIETLSGLLAEIQAIIVDLFWDKYHWVLQSVLYLSKEEGDKVLYILLVGLSGSSLFKGCSMDLDMWFGEGWQVLFYSR